MCEDFQAAMVERVMRANLFSAAHCVEAALPLLRQGERRTWWRCPAR